MCFNHIVLAPQIPEKKKNSLYLEFNINLSDSAPFQQSVFPVLPKFNINMKLPHMTKQTEVLTYVVPTMGFIH